MPVGMPPLTPGTNKKLAEVLKASFASWEKEAQNRNITKGKQNLLHFTEFISVSKFNLSTSASSLSSFSVMKC